MKFDIEKIYKEKEQEIIDTIKEFVAIESFYEEETKTEQKPFGQKISNIFEFVKRKCAQNNIICNNIDGYALEIILGQDTKEDFGILAHLDTVPVQENWDTNPFELTLKDNWYYGLGSSDDKGPSAILFVLIKYLNELNLNYKRQLKLVLGGSEERGFECLYHYFDKKPQMSFGVSPDADFPVINFEKSAYNFTISKTYPQTTPNDITILSVNAGTALNVVPQYTKVNLITSNDDISSNLVNLLVKEGINYSQNENNFAITFEGKPSHGMQPHLGVNAIYKFINFIKNFNLDSNFKSFVNDFKKTLLDDVNGKKLNIYDENKYGNTTNNLGIFTYDNNHVSFVCNIRFTNAFEVENVISTVKNAFAAYNVEVSGKPYHYVSEDSFIFKQTKLAYETVTKKDFVAQATGGGTYARMLKNGLAFGPSVDEDTNMHQNNERISKRNIETTFKIYLELINNICIEN